MQIFYFQSEAMKQDRFTLKIPYLRHFLLLLLMAGLLSSCGSQRTIVNGLDEKEANEILVFLSARGIDAAKQQAVSEGAGGKAVLWNINVDSMRANEAMALLNQAGLPRRRGQNLLGIFSNVGLVPSGMQEKIRFQAGLAEQIASTIRKIDGVLDADVQISFPEEDPLNPGATKGKITSSVYVKHNGVLDDPNAHLTSRIKRLVAGSINGLDYDNVTVIGDRARQNEALVGEIQGNEEDRTFVHVWSITLAKSDLTRFRIIFFSFTITILILTMVLILLIWKVYPLLKEMGGMKQLFSFRSIPTEKISKEETTAKPVRLKEVKKEEEDDEKENDDKSET